MQVDELLPYLRENEKNSYNHSGTELTVQNRSQGRDTQREWESPKTRDTNCGGQANPASDKPDPNSYL